MTSSSKASNNSPSTSSISGINSPYPKFNSTPSMKNKPSYLPIKSSYSNPKSRLRKSSLTLNDTLPSSNKSWTLSTQCTKKYSKKRSSSWRNSLPWPFSSKSPTPLVNKRKNYVSIKMPSLALSTMT